MNCSENDLDAIWNLYLNKTAPILVNQLKPVKNVLGSSEHHLRLFKEAIKEYTEGKCVGCIYLGCDCRCCSRSQDKRKDYYFYYTEGK